MTGQDAHDPLCILVVDDNRDAADILGLLLETLGHSVHTAHDGGVALERMADLHPDLIFLDLGMPLMDGYEVARRVRQIPKLAETRVIAVTGYVDERRRELASAAGFDDYLVKPTNLNELRRVIDRTRDLLIRHGQPSHPRC